MKLWSTERLLVENAIATGRHGAGMKAASSQLLKVNIYTKTTINNLPTKILMVIIKTLKVKKHRQ